MPERCVYHYNTYYYIQSETHIQIYYLNLYNMYIWFLCTQRLYTDVKIYSHRRERVQRWFYGAFYYDITYYYLLYCTHSDGQTSAFRLPTAYPMNVLVFVLVQIAVSCCNKNVFTLSWSHDGGTAVKRFNTRRLSRLGTLQKRWNDINTCNIMQCTLYRKGT